MQIQILRPSKFLKLCSFCSMSSSFTMFYPVLNPVEWHQKSIQILSKSLVWMVSTKNLWGKIVLRSLWVESCQWRSFLMNFRWFKGPIIFPPHPSESNIKEKFGTSSVFISKKKTERKVWTISCAHVLTCKSHLAGPPGKYQGNFKLVTLRRDIRRAKPSRVFGHSTGCFDPKFGGSVPLESMRLVDLPTWRIDFCEIR